MFDSQGKGWACKILHVKALRVLCKHLCILDHYSLISSESMPWLTRTAVQHIDGWIYSSGWQICKWGHKINLVANRSPSQRSLEAMEFRKGYGWSLCFLQQESWISTIGGQVSDIFQLSVCITTFRGKTNKQHICNEIEEIICLLESVHSLGQSIVLNHDWWLSSLQTWSSWSRQCPFMKLHVGGKDMILCTVMTLLPNVNLLGCLDEALRQEEQQAALR